MKEKTLHEEIEIQEGVTVTYEEGMILTKGPKGEAKKKLIDPKISVQVDSQKIILHCENASKRQKTMIGSFKAHIKNLMKGVSEGFIYKLKICSGHFPMNVALNNTLLTVKNFLGEKVPRTLTIKEGAHVKIEGSDITVESVDKEIAGQTAADIEQLCRITNRDRRIFQDGIYIIEKSGKKII